MAVLGAIAGIVAGGIMMFLSHVAPRYGAAEYARDVDVIRCFGRTCSRRESHVIGVLVHAILYAFFGLLYAVGVEQGVADGYTVVSLLVYVFVLAVAMGGIIVPLEGHGLFGVREDKWFMIDLVLANLGWIILYGAFMSLWY
jgi:hypothetical protein